MQNRDDNRARPAAGGQQRRPAQPQRPAQQRPAARPPGQQARPQQSAQQRRPAQGQQQGAGGGAGGQPPRRPQRRGAGVSRWLRAIIMVLATIGLCMFFAYFILLSAMDLFGLNQVDQQIEVEIPKSATVREISEILYESGVIDQPTTFRIYVDRKVEEDELHPGNYIFNSNMGYDEIIVAMRTGNTIKEEVRITFIEGWTLNEIAAELEAREVCDAQAFKDYLQTAEFNSEFINDIPQNPLRYYRLEGYLFPDTYFFYKGQDVKEVAAKFLNNFNDKITDDMHQKMERLGLTLDEVVTLASIIQREAGDPEDMAMVSSAFHNRLNNMEEYPSLQSDVTVLYVNDNIKPYLDRTNQPMYDAYNTYVAQGLPVGAICNPGEDALKAALNPADTGYYYFVTDSEGKFYYAETGQEHYRNVATASGVGTGETHGIDTM